MFNFNTQIMKTLLLTLLFLMSGHLAFSQQAMLTLSADSLCAGQSLTATVHPPLFGHLGASGVNQQNGIMFDITALNDCMIRDFVINNNSANATIEVYMKLGSHAGHENSAASWTLVGTKANLPAGTGMELGLNLNLSIITGQTRAFYITTNSANHYISYANGVTVGAVASQNNFFQLKTGVGKSYPFGNTHTARDFVGFVNFSPAVLSVMWNTGDTTSSITMTLGNSVVLSAGVNLAGSLTSTTERKAVIVSDLLTTAKADPYQIQPGGVSTLSGEVTLKRGVATTMEAGNSHNGAMFDVMATKPLKIEGFTINHAGAAGTVEILYKTGTHAGFESNAAVWISLGVFTQLTSGTGDYLPLTTPLNVAEGETIAFYITSTTGHNLSYTNGLVFGQPTASAPGIVIKEGKGVVYPFGTLYSPRILNTIIHYEVTNPPGSVYQWNSGGSGGSVMVSPGVSTTYTLQVTNSGCQASDTVTVIVSGIGIDEPEQSVFLVYPNPATNMLTIETPWDNGIIESSILDLNGRQMPHNLLNGGDGKVNIPLTDLPAGIYILKVTQGQYEKATKVQIIR
jgi:hypothetical protein